MYSQYRFRIADSFTPATLPMERLAEYMNELSRLLGEATNVHFSGVLDGSAILVADVDLPARAKVRDRTSAVRDGIGPRDALKAFEAIDEMLRKDNATGALMGDNDAIIVQFPGNTRPEPLIFGPFKQDGTLDGQVFRIGGEDDTIHVHVRDGAVRFSKLETTHPIALRLRHHLFGPTLRFHGVGTWIRHGNGSWELIKFIIRDFEELSDSSLQDVIGNLRSVKGSKWGELPDPVQTLLDERHSGELPN